MVACSSGSDAQTKNTKSSKKDFVQHIHSANKCINAVVHTHADAKKDHEHISNCEGNTRLPSNAHVHPATKLTTVFRHVHPGGSKKHKHHK